MACYNRSIEVSHQAGPHARACFFMLKNGGVMNVAKGKAEYWCSAEGLALITGMTEDSATDQQIADRIEISRSTLAEWKKKYPAIAKAAKFDAAKVAAKKYAYWLTKDGLMLITAWVRDGFTDEQLAGRIGISRSTLSEWKIKYPEIADAMARSKEVVDVEVENACLKGALGYDYLEQQAIKLTDYTYDENTGKLKSRKERVEVVIVRKVVPADPRFNMFWLKNRNKDAWQDKPAFDEDDRPLDVNIHVIDTVEQVK